MLLRRQANPLAVGKQNETPRQVATSEEIVELLRQAELELELEQEPQPEADDTIVQALEEHAAAVRELELQLVQKHAQRENCTKAGCSELELQELAVEIGDLEHRICTLQETDQNSTCTAAKKRAVEAGRRHVESIQTQVADAAFAAALHVRPGEGQDIFPSADGPAGIAVGSIESHRLYGGLEVEQLMLDVDLVDARYLISLAAVGGLLPRCQELPGSAKISPKSAWRLRWGKKFSLPVLVVSYPWLSKEHPDPHGLQLQRISPILEAMVAEAQALAGQHCTVGVMLDYCSLPQVPRTEAEQEKFDQGLSSMHKWYAHPFTHVLLMTAPLPAGRHSNAIPYMSRGWCYIEQQMAALVKNSQLLWDYAGYDGAKSYDKCNRQLQAHRERHPPRSPDQVEEEMRQRTESGDLKFSYIEDLQKVVEMYRRGFVDAFNGYRALRCVARGHSTTIWYGNLGWGPSEAADLARALEYAHTHCPMTDGYIEIELTGNRLGESGVDVLTRVPCVRLSGLTTPRMVQASSPAKFVLVLDACDEIEAVESSLCRVNTAAEKAMSGQ